MTLTPLRPAGIIDVEGVRLDVLTRGEFIEKGKEVKIIDIVGSRIVVGV
jgi:membrane-bound serine protease (ClpP class)